jgi:hypothetical protein
MRSRIMVGLKLLRNLQNPGLSETMFKKQKGQMPKCPNAPRMNCF